MRDRRDYRDRHVDRPRGSTWHPKPDSSSRRFRPRSNSPSVRRHRRDYIERHPGPVHRNPVHQDHLPVHHHSVTVRDRPYDLPPLNHLLPEYPSDMNQEMKHKPLLTHKDPFLDDGLGGESDLLQHRGTHMLDEGDRCIGRERERSLYPRERENPLSLAKPSARNEREREKSLFAREREPPLSDTMITSLAERDREKSLYPRETQNPLSDPMLTSRVERERSLYPRERETPLSVTLQPSLSLTERDRERTQYNTRDPPVSDTIPPFRTERERERNNHDTIKLQTSLEERDRERNNYTIPPFRTERDRERTHFPTRERDRDRERSTIPSSHLRPINGGPSSFYRDHLYEKEEDDLMNRRDRYNNLTSNEPLKKVPLYYPNHDYDDGYTARSARVFVDPVHSNYSPRHPLHHMVHPFHMHDHHDDVPYNLHHRATYRDRSESPIFHDNNRGKGIHGPLFHDNRHRHVHHMHDLYDDDHDSDIDGDHYGYIPKRIPVKERIVERERGERMRRPNFTSKKPMFPPRAKYNNDEIYHARNIKKRPLDRNEGGYNNYKPPHKYQKRAFLEEDENENEDKNEDEIENFDDDSKNEEERENENDESIVLKRDPPEGSEEFKREVEKAFINFAKKINGTSREKNKFLQSRREGLGCYVCASESKTFAETHNLVVHSYHTKKPGLRTAHLGLQKALCLLMGWNWLIVPDESRTYQMAPPGEAKLLKQDRLVWPPIVVIRNSSILSRVSKPRIVTVSEIEDMLKGIIGEGKGKVCYSKPANQSVFLVKFDPTLSGYETAKLIHNHFTNKNKGKDHFDNFIQNRDRTTKEKVQGGDGSDKEDVLFGYMAGIEDLDKLDCPKVHIKSKREIEAIVEAT